MRGSEDDSDPLFFAEFAANSLFFEQTATRFHAPLRVDEKGAVGFFEENFRPLPILTFDASSGCGKVGREFHLDKPVELDVEAHALHRN